jgi:glucose/arabinose dehydrogenase
VTNRSVVLRVAAALTACSAVAVGLAAAPLAPAAAVGSTVVSRVNFQSEAAVVPEGYLKDFGEPYSDNRGYGWVAQDSATPLSLVGNGRDRNFSTDQRIDTLIHMQLPKFSSGGVSVPGRWEHSLPFGTYDVTVSVGDLCCTDSVHRLTVEGVVAVDNFRPTGSTKLLRVTIRVSVADGRLTLDAAGGTNTKINYVDIASVADGSAREIIDSDPRRGATEVPVTASVTLSLSHPADPATIGAGSVRVTAPDGAQIPGAYNSDAAGSLVSFTPTERLSANSVYKVATTIDLKDSAGISYQPYEASFTTGAGGLLAAPFAFDSFAAANVHSPTVVRLGPDGKLYVANSVGQIMRYTLGSDRLPTGPPQVIDTFRFQRIILGMEFDPASTPSAPILWVSHGYFAFEEAPEFSGRISVMSGPNLENVRDVIDGLPRSTRDHMNNGVRFGPDGKLYIAQGATTGYGAPDIYWGMREEAPLSAAILVADVKNDIRFSGPLPVNTDTRPAPDGAGYDAFAADAPVKVHAAGLRNSYDMVWHSNGSLYAPVNESAAGSNAPAGPDGTPPALTNLPAMRDFLAKVVPGRYYGHPNPSRGQYVLNGGNPTAGIDPFDVPHYPVGTAPDPRYERPILDLGLHRSADGVEEYTSDAFGAALRGKLLIAEFSNGDDLLAVGLDGSGRVSDVSQLAGGFANPLDVTVDSTSGSVYVAEFGNAADGSEGRITLLRPVPGVTTTPVARVNFQNESAPVPTGYAKDFGEPFDAARGRGWIAQDSPDPLSIVGNGRDRNAVADQRLDTLVHMQLPAGSGGGVAVPARWEHALPSGLYSVSLSVGDASSFNSVHRIVAEGVTAMNGFVPSASTPFSQSTLWVNVTDGRLTLEATGGTNTKINYVDIDRVQIAGPDSTPPSVGITLTGTPNGTATYSSDVSVDIRALDSGSGIDTVTYRLDGGAPQPYSAPFTVSATGLHTVEATARDVAGNTAGDTETFTIDHSVPDIRVESPDDILRTSTRLVFSTVAERPRAARQVTVRNTGGVDLHVHDVAISGPHAEKFRLATGQPRTFVVPPGATAPVAVEFAPLTSGMENRATLRLTTDDPDTSTVDVALTGLDSSGFEGSAEPRLAGIVRMLGYGTNVGSEGSLGSARTPVGDEVVSPYWKAANPSKPIELIPVARYTGRTTADHGQTGWITKFSTTPTQVFAHAGGSDAFGGENQRLLPAVKEGGSTSFSTSGIFGLHLNNRSDWSDDAKNTFKAHNLRYFAAKDAAGNRIPDAWLVANDCGCGLALSARNFDYNDHVLLLVNAVPELVPAPAPGTPPSVLDFAAPVTGTVSDKDGQGTGFTRVQANGTGTQFQPASIDLDPAGGVLRLTSTAGTNDGAATTQANALELAYDATRAASRVEGRLAGPLAAFTQGSRRAGVYLGPDQANFFGVRVESRGGTPSVVVWYEQNGTGSVVAEVPLAVDPAAAHTVDLVIHADVVAGRLTASYRVDSDDPAAFTAVAAAATPTDVMRWFSSQAKAGVLTSHVGSATAFTTVFESFRVVGG